MSIFPNPKRFTEILSSKPVRESIDALITYRRKDVLQTVAVVWGLVLAMTFSMIVTVRAAFIVF